MATKGKKLTKQQKLAKLRDKLANTKISGGGGGGYFTAKQGINTIRILPEVGEMTFFFQPVGTHEFPDKRRVYCPNFISEGELECPVCEVVNELYRSGDKELGGKLRVRRKWWLNVIDRDNEAQGPIVLTAGPTIFGPIAGYISDPDYGEIYDIEDGIDVKIVRTGTGMETSYEVRPTPRTSPLHDDKKQIDEWLANARDLSWVEATSDPDDDEEISQGGRIFVLPYDRIMEEFSLDEFLEDFEEYEYEEDDEDEDGVEYEDDEDYEDDEELEEEEEEETPRKVINRTRARRRTRPTKRK